MTRHPGSFPPFILLSSSSRQPTYWELLLSSSKLHSIYSFNYLPQQLSLPLSILRYNFPPPLTITPPSLSKNVRHPHRNLRSTHALKANDHLSTRRLLLLLSRHHFLAARMCLLFHSHDTPVHAYKRWPETQPSRAPARWAWKHPRRSQCGAVVSLVIGESSLYRLPAPTASHSRSQSTALAYRLPNRTLGRVCCT